MAQRSPYRDALRLLYIFINGAEPLNNSHPSGAVAIFHGESKLHAFDFWIRNPDYLAEELLDIFVATKNRRYFDAAKAIFDAEEPDIRKFPMIRFRFGAYERLDDTLALLTSRGLVRVLGTKTGGKITGWDFLIMPKAFELADAIVVEHPTLNWYAQRAALVAEVAGGRVGSALKKRQYEQADYAETELGGIIPPIDVRVRARLEKLMCDA